MSEFQCYVCVLLGMAFIYVMGNLLEWLWNKYVK